MTDPLVSVVIPAFNTGRYLPETLESVFAQSYPNLEIIVVDDGSTDDTLAVARGYCDRIVLLERPHAGLGPTRSAGIERAVGEFLLFLDSDDILEPDAVRTQVDVALRHPGSGLVVGDGIEFDGPVVISASLFHPVFADLLATAPSGEVTGWRYRDIVRACPAKTPGQTLVPRTVADAVGALCTTPEGAQDYDYYLRIARRFPVTIHSRRVARWRFRPDSMSGTADERQLRWSANAVGVYERELTRCPPEDRDLVQAMIAVQARVGFVHACVAVATSGTAPEAAYLAVVAPHLSWRERFVVKLLPAVPTSCARPVLRGTRAMLHVTRRVTRLVAGPVRSRPGTPSGPDVPARD